MLNWFSWCRLLFCLDEFQGEKLVSQRKWLAYGTWNIAKLPSKRCIFQISRWSTKHYLLPCRGNRPCLYAGIVRDHQSPIHQKHGELNSRDLTVWLFLTWLKSPPPGKTTPLAYAHQNLNYSFHKQKAK